MKVPRLKNKYWPILLCLILFLANCAENESNEYIIEIMDENGSVHEKIPLRQNDIAQIGLDERRGSYVGVEIVLSRKVSAKVKKLSAEHTGKRLNIRRGAETLISAIIKTMMMVRNPNLLL
jgi:hypothetical protein